MSTPEELRAQWLDWLRRYPKEQTKALIRSAGLGSEVSHGLLVELVHDGLRARGIEVPG